MLDDLSYDTIPMTHVWDTLIQERFGRKDLVEINGNWIYIQTLIPKYVCQPIKINILKKIHIYIYIYIMIKI
jgi:hypothetical protein